MWWDFVPPSSLSFWLNLKVVEEYGIGGDNLMVEWRSQISRRDLGIERSQSIFYFSGKDYHGQASSTSLGTDLDSGNSWRWRLPCGGATSEGGSGDHLMLGDVKQYKVNHGPFIQYHCQQKFTPQYGYSWLLPLELTLHPLVLFLSFWHTWLWSFSGAINNAVASLEFHSFMFDLPDSRSTSQTSQWPFPAAMYLQRDAIRDARGSLLLLRDGAGRTHIPKVFSNTELTKWLHVLLEKWQISNKWLVFFGWPKCQWMKPLWKSETYFSCKCQIFTYVIQKLIKWDTNKYYVVLFSSTQVFVVLFAIKCRVPFDMIRTRYSRDIGNLVL